MTETPARTMRKRKWPKYVRAKRAKGRLYLYYDTGQRDENGKAVLLPLPSADDPGFGTALAVANRARARRGNVPAALTVSGLADMYEISPEFKRLAKRSQSNYLTFLKQIRDRLGLAPAAELTPRDVLITRDRIATPGAANQFVAVLGALYKWGRKRQHVATRPTDGIERLEGGEHDPWPEWLVEAALKGDDPVIRQAVGLLYFTAGRISEVVALRWSDLADNVITLRAEKNKRTLHIPVHRDLAPILAATPKRGLTILVGTTGKQWQPSNLRKRIQDWAAKHGETVVPHGLRKNAVNALLEAGCSVAETAAISGQTMQMVEHYAKERNRRRLASAAILKWEGTTNGKAGS